MHSVKTGQNLDRLLKKDVYAELDNNQIKVTDKQMKRRARKLRRKG